jgi:hypothetical protein
MAALAPAKGVFLVGVGTEKNPLNVQARIATFLHGRFLLAEAAACFIGPGTLWN